MHVGHYCSDQQQGNQWKIKLYMHYIISKLLTKVMLTCPVLYVAD